MAYLDEKDYVMRLIKEMVRVLASLMFGKRYQSVELPSEPKFLVAGKNIRDYKDMIDKGLINEAENEILESLHYENHEEVFAAALFYEYLSEKDDEFLKEHNYTRDEVLEGMQQLVENAGYGGLF